MKEQGKKIETNDVNVKAKKQELLKSLRDLNRMSTSNPIYPRKDIITPKRIVQEHNIEIKNKNNQVQNIGRKKTIQNQNQKSVEFINSRIPHNIEPIFENLKYSNNVQKDVQKFSSILKEDDSPTTTKDTIICENQQTKLKKTFAENLFQNCTTPIIKPKQGIPIEISSDQEDSLESQTDECFKNCSPHSGQKKELIVKNQIQKQIILAKQSDYTEKQIFSTFKASYICLKSDETSRLAKELQKLRGLGKIWSYEQSKIHLKEKYISTSKTANLKYFFNRILKKEDLRNEEVLMWVWKGGIKNFQMELMESIKNGQRYMKSNHLLSLNCLAQFYTIAHLLATSSNLLFITQIPTENFILWNKFKCSYCQEQAFKLCLCLKSKLCGRFPCSKTARNRQYLHESICKFAEQYKDSQSLLKLQQYSRRGLVGLFNNENSCFINTALQCLAACKPLTKFFLSEVFKKNLNEGNQFGTFGQIATRYRQFIQQIHYTTRQYLKLKNFTSSLIKWDNKYQHKQQQDCQQFLIQLLDWLKEDLNLNHQRPIYKQLLGNDEQEKIKLEEMAKEAWDYDLKRNNSIIQQLMAGLLRSTIECIHCKYQSNKFQTFLTLPLPIPKLQQQLSSQSHTNCIQITVVFHNFSKPNYGLKYQLHINQLKQIVEKVRRELNISYDSELVSFIEEDQKRKIFQQKNIYYLEQLIDKARINQTSINLTMLEYRKIDYINFESYIIFQTARQDDVQNKKVNISFPRHIFFKKKEEATLILIIKKLLQYFYHQVFNNHQLLTKEQNYYCKFYNKQNIPFKIFLQNSLIELSFETDAILRNTTKILVVFTNKNDFNLKKFDEVKMIIPKQKPKLASMNTRSSSVYPKKTSIQKCFEEFEKPEIIDLDNCWFCPKCKEKRIATKKISIYKAPKILILFFKRFYLHPMNQYGQPVPLKISTFIEFPLELDLSKHIQQNENPYTCQPCLPKYKLFAVANHNNLAKYGHIDFGHYTANISYKNRWYDVNDEQINYISSKQVCNQFAYILFYQQIIDVENKEKKKDEKEVIDIIGDSNNIQNIQY